MSAKKVFISYSRANRDFAEKLVESLRSKGLEVWFDKQIRTGKKWDEVLEQQIREADNLVIVLSKHSVQSDYVKNEMFYAQQNNTTVNLIYIEDCVLPLAMARMHYIDFSSNYDEAVDRLVSDINYNDIDQSIPETLTRAVKKTSRKWIIIGIVGALLVVAGVFIVIDFTGEMNKPIEIDVDGIVENEEILPNSNWDNRLYKSKYDRTKIPEDMNENEVWNLISKTEGDNFDGLLYYLERYGNEANYRDIAWDQFLDQFDKEGYVLYEEPSTKEGPFLKPYMYLNYENEKLGIKIELADRQPKFGDIIIGIRDRVAPIYNGLLGIHSDASLTGASIGKDQMGLITVENIGVTSEQIKSYGSIYYKVKYRDY
jgi:hypothetical protein